MLLRREVFSVRESLHVGPDFRDGEEPITLRVENDCRDVMIEQRPFSTTVTPARQPNLEGVMPLHPYATAAAMPKKIFHFGGPLRMSGAAEAEPVRAQAGP